MKILNDFFKGALSIGAAIMIYLTIREISNSGPMAFALIIADIVILGSAFLAFSFASLSRRITVLEKQVKDLTRDDFYQDDSEEYEEIEEAEETEETEETEEAEENTEAEKEEKDCPDCFKDISGKYKADGEE